MPRDFVEDHNPLKYTRDNLSVGQKVLIETHYMYDFMNSALIKVMSLYGTVQYFPNEYTAIVRCDTRCIADREYNIPEHCRYNTCLNLWTAKRSKRLLDLEFGVPSIQGVDLMGIKDVELISGTLDKRLDLPKWDYDAYKIREVI